MCRYVERNPLRAELVRRAEDWRWSSLWRREQGDEEARSLLADWPVDGPRDWVRRVNQAETAAELDAFPFSCRFRVLFLVQMDDHRVPLSSSSTR